MGKGPEGTILTPTLTTLQGPFVPRMHLETENEKQKDLKENTLQGKGAHRAPLLQKIRKVKKKKRQNRRTREKKVNHAK